MEPSAHNVLTIARYQFFDPALFLVAVFFVPVFLALVFLAPVFLVLAFLVLVFRADADFRFDAAFFFAAIGTPGESVTVKPRGADVPKRYRAQPIARSTSAISSSNFEWQPLMHLRYARVHSLMHAKSFWSHVAPQASAASRHPWQQSSQRTPASWSCLTTASLVGLPGGGA